MAVHLPIPSTATATATTTSHVVAELCTDILGPKAKMLKWFFLQEF